MSIVSKQLGIVDVPIVRRKPNVAVQYAKNDTDFPEPADFTLPASMPCFNNVNPSASMPYKAPTGENVPLVTAQYGSGQALFNYDSPAETAQLDIPSYLPLESSVAYKGQYANIPEPAPFNYDMGIRDGPRAIETFDYPEPAPAILYRKSAGAYSGLPSGKVTDGISFDVGIDELRQMATRRPTIQNERPKLLRPDDLLLTRGLALERPD